MLLIISFGYVIKNHLEIEKYKQINFWYEDLDLRVDSTKIDSTKVFSDFIEQTQENLQKYYNKYYRKSKNQRVIRRIEHKIIVDDRYLPDEEYVPWKILKTDDMLKVYYGYSGVIDFDSKQINNRIGEKKQSRNDKIFKIFTDMMIKNIGKHVEKKTNDNDDSIAIQNFHNFSKEVINFLTNDEEYWKKIPDLRINSIYIFNIDTGFLLSYPFTDQPFSSQIDFKTRPWFRATENNYFSSFLIRDNDYNQLGVTGIYLDINDENKPNKMRTIWYKFKDQDTEQEYILCLDIFLDQSHQIVQEENLLYVLEEPFKSRIWIYLLPLSVFIALCLSLLYEFILKPILVKLLKHNDFVVKTKLKRTNKNYAGKDGVKTIEMKVETKSTNKSEQSMEAGWNVHITPISPMGFSVQSNESNATEQETTFSYEFTNTYNLNMIEEKPIYRCIETWELVSECQSSNSTKIGLFVAYWNTNNSADLEEVLDIKSIYLDQDYKEYLVSLKEQLREHLLLSEKPELVAVLDRQYTKRKTIPQFLEKIDSLKTLINSSSYLQQGKIVFSEIRTLAELYKEGTVKAICSLHFLKNLTKKQQLKYFLDVPVAERYLIEYEEDEFRNFYDSLDDETKSKLINQSTFKIMVYQDDIENIISPQDDFCIISLRNGSKLVAYSFTDHKYSHTSWLGWISWREVDSQFYDELYKCQLHKNHLIQTIRAYIEGKS